MSRAARFTLIGAIAFSTFTVWGVHHLQRQEQETMYAGVIRDDKRRKDKMKQRQEDVEESIRKQKIYEAVQPVTRNNHRPEQ